MKEEKGLTNNSVEFTTLVSLRIPLCILRLAGTVLAKILGGFGRDVGKKLHFDAAEGLAWFEKRKC